MKTLSELRKEYAANLITRNDILEHLNDMNYVYNYKESFNDAVELGREVSSKLDKIEEIDLNLKSELDKTFIKIEAHCRRMINHTTSCGADIIKHIMNGAREIATETLESISIAKERAIKDILFDDFMSRSEDLDDLSNQEMLCKFIKWMANS